MSQRDSDLTDIMQLDTYTYNHAQGRILELTMVSAYRALLHPRGCAGTVSMAPCTLPAPHTPAGSKRSPGPGQTDKAPRKRPRSLLQPRHAPAPLTRRRPGAGWYLLDFLGEVLGDDPSFHLLLLVFACREGQHPTSAPHQEIIFFLHKQ